MNKTKTQEFDNSRLSRPEATMLARVFKERKIELDWMDLYLLRPSHIADQYPVSVQDVLLIIRRVEE
jgi:hypothetical protein